MLGALIGWSPAYASVPALRARIIAAREARSRLRRDDARLVLATVHSTKGLEFDVVACVGLDEGRFPSARSLADADDPARALEEERRLAYVGITRAQRTCTFSYCTHRKRYGEISECEPSRFLNELPADDLEWINKKQLTQEVIKERGKANLANLKTMLS